MGAHLAMLYFSGEQIPETLPVVGAPDYTCTMLLTMRAADALGALDRGSKRNPPWATPANSVPQFRKSGPKHPLECKEAVDHPLADLFQGFLIVIDGTRTEN